jgi:hypothetical protein
MDKENHLLKKECEQVIIRKKKQEEIETLKRLEEFQKDRERQ